MAAKQEEGEEDGEDGDDGMVIGAPVGAVAVAAVTVTVVPAAEDSAAPMAEAVAALVRVDAKDEVVALGLAVVTVYATVVDCSRLRLLLPDMVMALGATPAAVATAVWNAVFMAEVAVKAAAVTPDKGWVRLTVIVGPAREAPLPT